MQASALLHQYIAGWGFSGSISFTYLLVCPPKALSEHLYCILKHGETIVNSVSPFIAERLQDENRGRISVT